MGVSIHYSGIFNKNASLSRMIDEVADIAETHKWKYHVYNKEFPDNNIAKNSYNENIYGISFTPPGCETVSLCFLSNKRMSSLPNLKFFGNINNKSEQKYLYMLSVKTQFAGEEIHKLIIELFRYLKKQKYFEYLKIVDEGKYWETGDENILHDIFKQNTALLDSFSFAIKNVPIKKTESYEGYFKRLAKMIRFKNYGKNK